MRGTYGRPKIDPGFLEDEDNFLNYDSPFLDFGFIENESMQYYFNRITHTVADDVEYRLGINEWQARFHPETQVHPNLVILQNLALPPPDKESEVMTRPEPPVADQVTNCDVICVCVQ